MAGWTGTFRVGEQSDVWLIKADAAGDSVWAQAYDCGGFDEAGAVIQTNDRGFAIAGTFAIAEAHGPGASDFFLIRTNEIGEAIWTRKYGGAGTEVCKSVVQTPDGGFALAGWTTSFGSGGGYSDFWLLRTTVRKIYPAVAVFDG